MPRLLAAIDVYVQPSVNEGLSLSILEAMAAGKAVVATRVGGTGEVIADGETGVLVPPGSSAALAAAILRLLADPDAREAIVTGGARPRRVEVRSSDDDRRLPARFTRACPQRSRRERPRSRWRGAWTS